MKKPAIIVIAILLLAVATYFTVSALTNDTESEDKMMQDDAVMEKDEVIEGDAMMKEDESMEDDSMMDDSHGAGAYVNYEDVDISKLEGKIVLDFSATWCPSCKALKTNIEENLDNIPSDVTIVVVDYDSNKDLRVKYGVTTQHTFVQIDNEGSKLKLWTGSSTLDAVVSELE